MGNMNEVTINDGVEEFTFKNNFGEVFARFRFNPTDTGIIGRYDKIVEYLNGIKIKDDLSDDESIQLIKDIEAGLKEQFNVFCGCNVADGLFMTYQPMTLFASGDFYAEIALEQIVKFVEQALDTRLDKKKAKIRKQIAQNRK